jgi:hypothetical protein
MSLWFRDGAGLSRILATSVAVLPAMLFSDGVTAQARLRLETDASVYLSENPFLLAGGDRDSAAVEVGVQPTLTVPIGHASSLEVGGVARFRQYQRLYGDFVTGRFDARVRHRDSEYLSLEGAAGYARELPTDALTDSIDAAIDSRSLRVSYTGQASIDWSPDARTTVNADANVQRITYPDSLLLQTTKGYDFMLGVRKQVSPFTTLGVQGQYVVSDTGDAGTQTARSFRLTAAQRLSPHWRADVQMGVEWTSLRTLLSDERERRARFTGSANLCNESERLSACVNASLRSDFSALYGLQREIAVGATAQWTLSPRSSFSLTSDYRRARTGLSTGSLDVFRVTTAYQHRLNERFSLRGGVNYLHRTRLPAERTGAAIFFLTVIFEGRR